MLASWVTRLPQLNFKESERTEKRTRMDEEEGKRGLGDTRKKERQSDRK